MRAHQFDHRTLCRLILLEVDINVPVEVIADWTDAACEQAARWAGFVLEAQDNLGTVEIPPVPVHLAEYVARKEGRS